MRFLSTTLLLGSVGVLTGTAVVAAPLRIVVVGKASDSGPAPLAPAAIEDFLRSVRIGHAGANGNIEPNSIEEITNVAAGSNNNRIALDEIMAEEMKAAVSSIPIGSPLFPGGFIPSSTPESGMGADRPRMPVPMTPEGEFEIPTTLVEEMLAEMDEAEKEMEVEAMKIKQWLEDEMINSGVTPATEMTEGAECRMLEEGSLRDRMERMNDRVRGWFGLAAVERTPLCSSLWPGAEAEMMETIVRGKKMLAPPLPIDLPLPSSMPLHVVEGSVNVATEESPRMPCHQGATRPIDVDEVRAIPVNRPMRTSVWIHHLHRQRMRQSTFWGRLQRALYALSPWEGRALAFVVGCGLGVLVRMIYVFIVIGVRMWRREQKKRAEGQVHLSGDEEDGDGEIVGVVLFDAASIKGSSSQDDLPLYTEKE